MINYSEWIVLFLIGIILIKPDDLPIIAKNAGKFIGYLKSFWKEILKNQNNENIIHKKQPFWTHLEKAAVQPHKD